MRYGYFDEQNKEYVIDRPDTPAPWAYYLGSPEYGAIISNNAGGYSFEKSGANGRILRYIFNSFDQPGRYVYLRDDDTKDYWSASWQPVGKSLDVYKSECHHGTAYTKMYADYSDIKSEVMYYVPLNKTHEVWKVRVTNNSDKPRNLSAIGYCEFTNDCNYEQDQVNLQYTLFITRTYFMDNNKILQVINENVEKAEINGSKANRRFFALAGSDVASYCGDKEEFLGGYHGYGNPIGVINGDLGNKLNYNSNACGGLQTKFTLAPGESKDFAFIVGMKDNDAANAGIAGYADPAAARTRLTISAIIIRVNRWRQLVPREFFSPLKIYNYIVIRICSVVRFICDIHRNHPQAAVIIISPACKAVICRFVHPPTSDIHKVSVRIHQTFLLEISHNIEHIRRIYSPGVIVYVHTVYRHLYAIHNKRLVQSYKCVLVIHLDRINIIRIVIIKC